MGRINTILETFLLVPVIGLWDRWKGKTIFKLQSTRKAHLRMAWALTVPGSIQGEEAHLRMAWALTVPGGIQGEEVHLRMAW